MWLLWLPAEEVRKKTVSSLAKPKKQTNPIKIKTVSLYGNQFYDEPKQHLTLTTEC